MSIEVFEWSVCKGLSHQTFAIPRTERFAFVWRAQACTRRESKLRLPLTAATKMILFREAWHYMSSSGGTRRCRAGCEDRTSRMSNSHELRRSSDSKNSHTGHRDEPRWRSRGEELRESEVTMRLVRLSWGRDKYNVSILPCGTFSWIAYDTTELFIILQWVADMFLGTSI